jgi:hypothetical protein
MVNVPVVVPLYGIEFVRFVHVLPPSVDTCQ